MQSNESLVSDLVLRGLYTKRTLKLTNASSSIPYAPDLIQTDHSFRPVLHDWDRCFTPPRAEEDTTEFLCKLEVVLSLICYHLRGHRRCL